MKAALAILGALAISSTTFAASKSNETLSDLMKIGVTAAPSKSGIRLAIQDADCGESLQTGEVSCEGIDLGAPGGKKIELKGDKAQTLMAALFRHGGMGDEGMGKLWISAKLIECKQAGSELTKSAPATCSLVNE